MARTLEPDYEQRLLLPPSLEDWVPADHPARFIREFVDQLDLKALGFVVSESPDGRPGYHPGLMLKIWLYGYFQRIRSSRKLEVACREHLSLVWLCGMLTPDHNSLWRFWSQNQKAMGGVFKQTVRLALKTGAVGLALQALDGTRIEAACSRYTGWSKEKMEGMMAQLDKALDQVQQSVQQENPEDGSPGYRLPEELSGKEALRRKIRQGLEQLQEDGRSHYHAAEPEARRMQVGQTNRYAYNAQAVADAREGVIVACEAGRQENDVGQLGPMLRQAGENLEQQNRSSVTLADTGYGSGADLQEAAGEGMEVLAPSPQGRPPEGNPYAAQHFHYDAQEKSVRCPEGRYLEPEGEGVMRKGQLLARFRCRHTDCPVRSKCTRDPKGRQIEIRPHHGVVQAMRQRLKDPEVRAVWKRRGSIIERPFAQIKQHDGFRRWTQRGLDGVRAQWAVLCATLNLRILYKRWST
jgi:transposase